MWPGGPLGLYTHTKTCRRRARVRRPLARAGTDRLPRERPQLRLLAALANRKVGWALAAALEVAHEALDEPVFEGVEADHGEPSARTEHRECRRKGGLERAELVVDRDAQRLEDAFRRMSVSEAGRGGNRGLDRLHKVARPLERLLLAAAHDRLRNLPGVALLAVPLEDRRQVTFVRFVHDAGGADVGGRIHAHVERRVRRVREAPFRTVDLHRRDAEVEQDRVGLDTVLCKLLEHDGEVAAKEARLDAGAFREAVEVRACPGIAIDRNQLAASLERRREQRRVAARTKGRVDD